MKRPNVRLAESSLERTARMLSKSYGIKVVFKANEAKTTGKTIYLPALPDDAPEELMDAMQGFLDHEAAHILFTDLDAGKKRGVTDKEEFACINIVEDIRIEDKMEDLFPGARINLQNLQYWLNNGPGKDNWSKANMFNKILAAYYMTERYPDSSFLENTVEDEVKDWVKKVQQTLKNDVVDTTDDAVTAGKKVFQTIQQFVQEEKERREKKEGEDRKNGKPSDDDAEGQIKLNAKGSAGQGKGNSNQQGQQSQQPGQQSQGQGVQQGNAAQALAQAAQKVSEKANQAGSRGGGHGYTHNLNHDGSYVVYSTDGDIIQHAKDVPPANAGARLMKFRDEARQYTSVIKMRLVNSLRAMQRRRWVGGKEEGKLDSKRLANALMNIEPERIYKERTEALKLDTAVAMAIDHSGSMSYNRRLELAFEAGIVLGDVFRQLKIPFMVYGYSSEAPKNHYGNNNMGQYARYNHLWINIYHFFTDPWEKGAMRLAAGSVSANTKENTLDGESVKWGIQQLMLRPEKRKVLLVLNDGQPYPGYGDVGRCQKYLKDVVASAAAQGVEVIAFGIESTDVREYYPQHVIINNVKDLVKEPLMKLDAILRKGMFKK